MEATYVTQVQVHSALEPHGLVAQWEGENLNVWASTQAIFVARDELAETLKIPASRVRVVTEYMGGGFGAKFGPRIEGVAAAKLAREAGAPVKLFLDRKEEQTAGGNRPSSIQTIKAGATKDGKLKALHLVVHGTGGTNGGTGTSGPAKNIYEVPNLKIEEYDVFTNAGPSAAFRAPGHPQGAFALEATMDALARKLGMDPLEFRMKNDPSEVRREEFRIGAEKIGWKTRDSRRATKDPAIVRGVGMGAAVWYNTGNPGPRATVTLNRDGSAEVEHGVQDLGTGSRTMVAIVAAEELGLPLEKVSVRIGDTRMPFGPSSGGSKTTPCSAPTIRRAAYQAKRGLAAAAAKEWKVPAESVAVDGGFVGASGGKRISWVEACKLLPPSGVSATADRAENNEGAWKRFVAGAQFAEVEVDTETGKVRVDRVVAVHDCGLAVNALTTESQIQGGVIQGVSYALFEDRVLDPSSGRMLNPNVEEYKIAGSLDCPDIETVLVPVWEGVNNTQSTGIGEPGDGPDGRRDRQRRLPRHRRADHPAADHAGGRARRRRRGSFQGEREWVMKPFTLVHAKSLPEASRAAAKPDAELKAGGVDLLDRMKEGFDNPKVVVSIASVPGLDHIETGPPGKLGALATLAAIAANPGMQKIYPALAAAAAGAATPQIRNMATLGGNLCQRPRCWYYRLEEFDCRKKGGSDCFAKEGENRFHAIFDTDLLCCCIHPSATGTALSAYGASLEVVSAKGKRTLPIDKFFYLPTQNATVENTLAPGEIVESVALPSPAPGTRSVYRKLKEKESFDWPLVEVAVVLSISGGTIQNSRVVFGSVAPIPHRSPEAEAALNGSKPGPETAKRAAEAAVKTAKPLSQNAYKVRLARVELERALREVFA